jgi:hypothetical protein
MGYSTAISQARGPDRWTVSVRVTLSRAETNELFLSGDSMVSWPSEGLLPMSEDVSIPERSGMFVSEIAAQAGGLVICYSDQADAERTLALLRAQFAQAGIHEEV